jgi:hypothetical protein
MLTYSILAGLALAENISQHMTEHILKYWQFLFKNYPSVLAKEVDCST